MKVVIDRFEGNYAVCEKEDRTMINIEKVKVPCHAKEGDVLIIQENEIIVDKGATLKRKKKLKNLPKICGYNLI